MFQSDDKKEFETLVAENRLVTDVQMAVERALEEREMSQAQLAQALKVSEARVSQILSGNGKNLQARTIARIAHVLGLQAVIEFADRAFGGKKIDVEKWSRFANQSDERRWNDIANENEFELAKAA